MQNAKVKTAIEEFDENLKEAIEATADIRLLRKIARRTDLSMQDKQAWMNVILFKTDGRGSNP
jgi:hypothetical protein